MHRQLIERLDALGAVLDAIRGKASDKQAGKLDELATARVLIAVDLAARRLSKQPRRAPP